MRRAMHGVLCALLLLSTVRALAESAAFGRTPAEVSEKMNSIFSQTDMVGQENFIGRVDYDDAGGFDFFSMDGERTLHAGAANAVIRGRTDEKGRVDSLSVVVEPSGEFGRAYGQQADWISRICVVSMFGSLEEDELQLLMDSYLYDIRPYFYTEGDACVPERVRMCELELQDEVVRIDSEAAKDNVLHLSMTFLYDADETTRARAQENGWRIRRLSQAASDCETIQTCSECLDEELKQQTQDRQEEIEALLELMNESAGSISCMQNEHMHAQESFLRELKENCAQLSDWIEEYHTACENADSDTAWLRLQDICRIGGEIGRMPETLY